MAYTGVRYVDLDKEKLEDLQFYPNEYIVTTSEGQVINKYRWAGELEELSPFSRGIESRGMSIKPLNLHQELALDLLGNNSIKIKVLPGVSGTGKTILALRVGLHKVLNNEFEKLIFVRHNVSAGEKLGYLPGGDEDKTEPWFEMIADNLPGGGQQYEMLRRGRKIEVKVPERMKGRSIENSFIIIDEAEDTDPDLLEMLGTRPSNGSVVVFTGDYEQTSAAKYKAFNGFKLLVDISPEPTIVGLVELIKTERSEICEFFATVYKRAKG